MRSKPCVMLYAPLQLNDKEEALAHQRKVSHMLAHNAKELQKQLPVEATWPLDSQTEPL